ncbi:DBH-like monooxygenase protein 2 homolog [Durusdinium trenchii]|uniref:DBH-like monooxygenase protein 2 homolog n=1 Tax=Durusdinium trenchii TaxID=1381693 RepID=A0ABP0JVN0_9DINO
MVPLLICILGACATTSRAYQTYQNSIPNGAVVKDDAGGAHPGVGHWRSGGGGELNPFGTAFRAAGYSWTEALCRTDSDGDGVPNGVELGDPECEWSPGATPRFDEFITHPGVAGSERTMYSFCDDYEEPAGTSSFRTTLSNYPVPTDHTTYAKMAFQPSLPEDVLVTRITPVIDQDLVVHHMLLYGCPSSVFSGYTTPQTTHVMPCQELLYAWAVGGGEFCFPPEIGIAVAASPTLMLEIHYDNPNALSSVLDSSGLELHYSLKASAPSTFKAAAWSWFGAAFSKIRIPPQLPFYEIAATYQVPDTSSIPEEGITVFASLMHGHQIARKLWATRERANQPTELISCEPRYDFDLQEITALRDTFQLKRGDKITVHCVYNSSARTAVTRGSDGTTDEMCMGLFLFYPALDFSLRVLTTNAESSETPLRLADAAVPCLASSEAGGTGSLAAKSFGEWVRMAPDQVTLHALLMFGAWFVFIPCGTFAPLLFKRNPSNKRWFRVHQVAMSVGLIGTLAGFALIKAFKSPNVTTHGSIGMAIIVCSMLQAVGGALRPHTSKDSDAAKSSKRRNWELAHQWLGRGLVVAAVYNITLGLDALVLFAGPLENIDSIKTVVLVFLGLGSDCGWAEQRGEHQADTKARTQAGGRQRGDAAQVASLHCNLQGHVQNKHKMSVPPGEMLPAEHDALSALKQELGEVPEDLPGREWLLDAGDLTYLRFLRGHKLKVKKAAKLLKACAKWREEYGANDITETWPKVNTSQAELVRRFWPMGVTGQDFSNRPVHYFHISMVDFPKLLKYCSMDMIVRHNVYLLEKAYDANPRGEAVMIVDLGSDGDKTFNLRNITRWLQGAVLFLKAMSKIADPYYPESYFRIYFVRVHKIFEKMYKTMSATLAEGTLSKVLMLKRDGMLDKLLEDIALESLPQELGGTSTAEIVKGGVISQAVIQEVIEQVEENDIAMAEDEEGDTEDDDRSSKASVDLPDINAASPDVEEEADIKVRTSLRKSISKRLSGLGK